MAPLGPIDRPSLGGVATVRSRIAPPWRICGAAAVHRRAQRRRRGQLALHWRNARVAGLPFIQKLMMYSELKHYTYKDVIMQQGEEGSKRLLIIGAGKVKIERQVRSARGRCGAAGAGGAIGSSHANVVGSGRNDRGDSAARQERDGGRDELPCG